MSVCTQKCFESCPQGGPNLRLEIHQIVVAGRIRFKIKKFQLIA